MKNIDKIKEIQEKIEILRKEEYSLKESTLSSLYEKAAPLLLEKEGMTVYCESIWCSSDHGTGYRYYDVCLSSDDESGCYKMESETSLIYEEENTYQLHDLLSSLNDDEKNIVKEFMKTFFIFSLDADFDKYNLPVDITDAGY